MLEGSVRKSGKRLRITAQLIRAADGYHVWSESYDRDLDDIFVVQEEIAHAVVVQLRVALLGEVPRVIRTNPEAYALALEARALAGDYSRDGFEQAIDLYHRALRIDPAYPLAWAGMSWAYASLTRFGAVPLDEGRQLARDAAEKALELAPQLPDVHNSLGYIAYTLDSDPAAAARHLQRGLQLDSRNLEVLRGSAFLLGLIGRCEEEAAVGRYLVGRDPYNATMHMALAIVLDCLGRSGEAISRYRQIMELSPAYNTIHANLAFALLRSGDAAGALAEAARESSETRRLLGTARALHSLGRHDESARVIAELQDNYGAKRALAVAAAYAWCRDADRAFEWLEKSAARREPDLVITFAPAFEPLHDDPRWLPFLRKHGFAPEQLAAIPFEVKLPQ